MGSVREIQKHLCWAIEAQGYPQLQYGLDFCPAHVLVTLFRNHPLWPRLRKTFSDGVDFPLKELPNEARKQDLLDAIEFGNHKGAIKNAELLEPKLLVEVEHAFVLPIPLNKVIEIDGALMAPMNIADQNTINERGEVIGSKRPTHNQSKEFSSGTSVNSRVRKDNLQDCITATAC